MESSKTLTRSASEERRGQSFDGVQVFSATKARERDELGDVIAR